MKLAALVAGMLLLAACGDTHTYVYPAPEQQEPAPAPEPTPDPAPAPTPEPTPPPPPAGTRIEQHWFPSVLNQQLHATLACRVTITPDPVIATRTIATLHGCQDGTTARVLFSTTAGTFARTIGLTDTATYDRHADLETADVHAFLVNGLTYPHTGPMQHQGTIRWHAVLTSTVNADGVYWHKTE